MKVGCFNILMARVANTSLFKRIRVFSNFCVFSNCWKGKRIGEFHWSWILEDRTQVWTGDEKNHHRVFIFAPSKQRPVKTFQVVVVHGKEIYQAACYTCKICCLTCKTVCFLTWLFSLLSPSSLLKPLSFIDVCKLLGIRMRFFVWGLYERLRNDRNTLNKISPESWIRNIYESSSVTVAPTRTIQWYLFLYRYFPDYF